MPCHPDRVRRNYEDDPFWDLDMRLNALFNFGRGIFVGKVNGVKQTVSRSYLREHGVVFIHPKLEEFVVED